MVSMMVSTGEALLIRFTCRTIAEIRSAIPARFFVRDTYRGLAYLARDVLMAAIAWKLALHIDPTFQDNRIRATLTSHGAEVARWFCWLV